MPSQFAAHQKNVAFGCAKFGRVALGACHRYGGAVVGSPWLGKSKGFHVSDLQGIRLILFGILLAVIGVGLVLDSNQFVYFLGIIAMVFGLLFGVMGQFGIRDSGIKR